MFVFGALIFDIIRIANLGIGSKINHVSIDLAPSKTSAINSVDIKLDIFGDLHTNSNIIALDLSNVQCSLYSFVNSENSYLTTVTVTDIKFKNSMSNSLISKVFDVESSLTSITIESSDFSNIRTILKSLLRSSDMTIPSISFDCSIDIGVSLISQYFKLYTVRKYQVNKVLNLKSDDKVGDSKYENKESNFIGKLQSINYFNMLYNGTMHPQAAYKLSLNAFEFPVSYSYPIPITILQNIEDAIGYVTIDIAAINMTVHTSHLSNRTSWRIWSTPIHIDTRESQVSILSNITLDCVASSLHSTCILPDPLYSLRQSFIQENYQIAFDANFDSKNFIEHVFGIHHFATMDFTNHTYAADMVKNSIQKSNAVQYPYVPFGPVAKGLSNNSSCVTLDIDGVFQNVGCKYVAPGFFKLYAALFQSNGQSLATFSTNLQWKTSSPWVVENELVGTIDINGGYLLSSNFTASKQLGILSWESQIINKDMVNFYTQGGNSQYASSTGNPIFFKSNIYTNWKYNNSRSGHNSMIFINAS